MAERGEAWLHTVDESLADMKWDTTWSVVQELIEPLLKPDRAGVARDAGHV